MWKNCGEGRRFMARVCSAWEREDQRVCALAGQGFTKVFKADLPVFIIAAAVAAPAASSVRDNDACSQQEARQEAKSHAALKGLCAGNPGLWLDTQRRRQWREGSLLTRFRRRRGRRGGVAVVVCFWLSSQAVERVRALYGGCPRTPSRAGGSAQA